MRRTHTTTNSFGQNERSSEGSSPDNISHLLMLQNNILLLPPTLFFYLPSMGVLPSGLFAKTTSTYSSCILWREPFKPKEQGDQRLRDAGEIYSKRIHENNEKRCLWCSLGVDVSESYVWTSRIICTIVMIYATIAWNIAKKCSVCRHF